MDADLRTGCCHGARPFRTRSAQAGDGGSGGQDTARCRSSRHSGSAGPDRRTIFLSHLVSTRILLRGFRTRRGPDAAWSLQRPAAGPPAQSCPPELIFLVFARFILRVVRARPLDGGAPPEMGGTMTAPPHVPARPPVPPRPVSRGDGRGLAGPPARGACRGAAAGSAAELPGGRRPRADGLRRRPDLGARGRDDRPDRRPGGRGGPLRGAGHPVHRGGAARCTSSRPW